MTTTAGGVDQPLSCLPLTHKILYPIYQDSSCSSVEDPVFYSSILMQVHFQPLEHLAEDVR